MTRTAYPVDERLLASISAVVLNLFFYGASTDDSAAVEAARQADSR